MCELGGDGSTEGNFQNYRGLAGKDLLQRTGNQPYVASSEDV